jgi:LysR family nitrogen assimilation transcriptional regulator
MRVSPQVVKTQAIEYFCKAALLGSISRAAQEYGINQSALSRHIHALENELGVALLYRNGRGVVPTQQGAVLLNRAGDALREIAQAKEDIIASNGTRLASAVIGMPPTLGRILVQPVAERLILAHPNVKLRFVQGFSGHLLEWLDEGKLDAAIVYQGWSGARAGVEHLVDERLCLVSAAGATWLGDSVASAVLGRVPLILPGLPHGLRRLVDAVALEQSLNLDIRIEADSLDAILALVRAGHGRSLLPLAAIREELARQELSVTHLRSPEVLRRLVLASPANRAKPRGFNLIAAAIRAELVRLG